MDGLFDQQELEIPCPHCRARFKITVGALKQPGVQCPLCSASFETSQFRQQLDKVEQSLKELQGSVKNIRINIKVKS
jgi:DNA-directed RNA polymerase subunit RPC12/RpoP